MQNTERQDIYTRITDKIVASLETGVRPWIKPWSADNAAGRITRPLRHNGVPYSGINVLMLWASAMEQGFGHLGCVLGSCASDRLSCNAQDLSRTPLCLTAVDPGERFSR